MVAVAWIAAVLAHGGTAGAVVELALVAGVVAIMLAVWVGNRRDGKERRD
jgi:hypothetical protein